MEQACARARELPKQEQDAIAAVILREIESEHRWGELFSQPKSADRLAPLGDEALADAGAGDVKKLDLDEL
jgi:hypothetical protein